MLTSYNNSTQFSNFSSHLCVTYVKFHHTNRPRGKQLECKMFYRKKYHPYGYKIEVPVSAFGLAIYASKHYSDSVANVTIYRKEIENHLNFT